MLKVIFIRMQVYWLTPYLTWHQILWHSFKISNTVSETRGSFQYIDYLFQNRDSHYDDKMVMRLSCLYDGNWCTSQTVSSYLDGLHVFFWISKTNFWGIGILIISIRWHLHIKLAPRTRKTFKIIIQMQMFSCGACLIIKVLSYQQRNSHLIKRMPTLSS